MLSTKVLNKNDFDDEDFTHYVISVIMGMTVTKATETAIFAKD